MDQYGRTGIAAHLKSVMRTMVNVDITLVKSNSEMFFDKCYFSCVTVFSVCECMEYKPSDSISAC